ncbi:MAG: molecular chaperone TorD family protein [Eggerthellaceae bacterium]|nr:molecular chaperone TorD family protein [Eggerthellaceae bacterium]
MGTYSLLARLFRKEVDEPFLEELRRMSFPAAAEDERIERGYSLMAKYLSGVYENTLQELAVDYVRVFIGYGMDAYSAAFPYESVYTSERRLLMQDSRDEVLALYRAAGLEKDKSWPESEDHLALELEYLAIHTRRAIEALEAGDEDEAFANLMTQVHFMDDHVLNWAPMMTADMRKFARTDLYLGLSYLTEGFLAEDRAFLGEVLGLPEEGDEAAIRDVDD